MMFFGGGMVIFWLLVLVGIIVAAAGLGGFAARNRQDSSGSTGQPRAKETPEDILRARYARGEISQEEYVQMQATLKS